VLEGDLAGVVRFPDCVKLYQSLCKLSDDGRR